MENQGEVTPPVQNETQKPSLPRRIKNWTSRYMVGRVGVALAGGVGGEELFISHNPLNAAIAAGVSLGLFGGAEAVMTKFYAPIELGSKSTEGFTVSPNIGAQRLEEGLGITFDQMPKKVVLTTKNKLTLARKAPVLLSNLLSKKKDMTASYNPTFNTFFINGEINAEVDLHENMHGYICQKNPDFLASTNQTHAKILALWKKEDTSGYDPEKNVIYHYFEEGMADWADGIVITALIDERINEGKPIDDLVGDQYFSAEHIMKKPKLLAPNEKFPSEEKITQVRQALQQLKDAFSQRKGSRLKKIRRGFQADNMLQDEQYSIGGAFVTHAMSGLIGSGMQRSAALDFLIQHPPQTLEEMLHPAEFTAKILS